MKSECQEGRYHAFGSGSRHTDISYELHMLVKYPTWLVHTITCSQVDEELGETGTESISLL